MFRRRAAIQQVMLAGAGLTLIPEFGWAAAWQLDAGRDYNTPSIEAAQWRLSMEGNTGWPLRRIRV